MSGRRTMDVSLLSLQDVLGLPTMVACSVCHAACAADKEDFENHKSVHAGWVESIKALGFAPMNYEQREEIKRQGRELLGSDDAAQRLLGGVLVVQGHFSRSVAGVMESGAALKHPSFEGYVSMYPCEQRFPEDVAAGLRQRYGSSSDALGPGNRWRP